MTTTKAKAKDDEQQAEQTGSEGQSAARRAEAAPTCGRPHFLPSLAARVTCTEPAPDPDLPPGAPEHEHRCLDGEALYLWR